MRDFNCLCCGRGKRRSSITAGTHRRSSFEHFLFRKPRVKKSVQFSASNDVHIYETSDDLDVSDLFYSEEDIEAMGYERLLDAKNINKKYETISSSGSEKELRAMNRTMNLTGVENLLTNNDIAQKLSRYKERQICSVLHEQERQQESGECDPLRLAQIATTLSVWSVQRAEKIAHHQSRSCL